MEGCCGYITEEENIAKREFYSHEQYMQLIVESGVPLSHDYGMRSVDEDPRMLAFFDSLIQRVNAGWFSDDSSDEESPLDEVLLQLASQVGEENDEVAQNAPNMLDFIRIFRSNRRVLYEESERSEDGNTRTALNRRMLRRLFTNETSIARDAIESEARLESVSDRPAMESSQSEGGNRNGTHSNERESLSEQEDSAINANSTVSSNSNNDNTLLPNRLGLIDADNIANGTPSSSQTMLLRPELLPGTNSEASSVRNDDDNRRNNIPCTFLSEVTTSNALSGRDSYCNLPLERVEATCHSCSRDICPPLSNCDKHPIHNQLSAHLCEKAKYACDCANDSNRSQIGTEGDPSGSFECEGLTKFDASGSETQTGLSGVCSYCSCPMDQKNSAEGHPDSKDCKRQRLDDSCSYPN